MLTLFLKARLGAPGDPGAAWRRVSMLLIGIVGLTILGGYAVDFVSVAVPRAREAGVAGTIAAIATALGTLPVLFAQRFSQRSYDCILGFGGGVMLGATAFSLIAPALAASKASGYSPMYSSLTVAAGIVGGAVLILLLDRLVTHDSRTVATDVTPNESLKHAWMFVAAVALHNLPEGVAIGVAYAAPSADSAQTLATAIAIQDVPEGLVVALTLRSVGYGRVVSAALGAASGLIEPIAAVAGVVMISLAVEMLPIGLAMAAGAMLFVIVRNVIPESHKNGYATLASISLTCGFTLMTILDTALV